MPTFNGDTLTITLDSGVTSVNVQDVYEAWKDWMLASARNRKYPQAFRSDGGAPLNDIINQGSYYFLNNSAGWRMKPPEEDITIYLTGNLAVEDTALPAFEATDGAFTAAILGLQPVTQGVTPELLNTLQYGSYEGGVWVDVLNGQPLSAISPENLGSSQFPVDNIPDAITINVAQGLPKTLYIIGSITLDTGDNVDGFDIVGQNAIRSQVTVNPGASTLGASFTECYLSGTLDGQAIVRNCAIGNVSYFNGYLFQCSLRGSITLGGGAQLDMMNCFSGIAGEGAVDINMGGSGQSAAIRAYVGGIELHNKTGTEEVSVDFESGQLKIDQATVTNGKIVARGDAKVIDHDTSDHLPSGTYGSLTLLNETVNGRQLQELWMLQGLDPDNPLTATPTSREAGDLTQTITGDPATSVTVTTT